MAKEKKEKHTPKTSEKTNVIPLVNPSSEANPTSQVMDKTAYFRNFIGFEKVAQTTVETFLSTLPKMMKDVQASIEAKDPKALKMAAHIVKGTLAIFHAKPAVTLASKLEQMGKQADITEAPQNFEMLKVEIERLKPVLENLFPARKAS